MTEQELDEIRQRCEAATPGPWQCAPWNTLPNGYLDGPAPCHEHQPPPPGLLKCYPPVSLRFEDAAFVAYARSDVPALLAEVERLTALIHAARLEEREACARLAETAWSHSDSDLLFNSGTERSAAGERVAAAIRARTETSQ